MVVTMQKISDLFRFNCVAFLLTEACYEMCPFIVEHPDTISRTVKLRGGNVHIRSEGY